MDSQRKEQVLLKLASLQTSKVKEAGIPGSETAAVLKKAIAKTQLIKALRKALMSKEMTSTVLHNWPKYHNILMRAMM